MAVSNGGNERKSLLMLISSMLIFGTIGLFRKLIPLPSAFLACTRGLLGGLFVLIFIILGAYSEVYSAPATAQNEGFNCEEINEEPENAEKDMSGENEDEDGNGDGEDGECGDN